ncbi:MAG: DNA-directed RNA polymerase subunit delta [Erysipelotrichaceae bacterium]
MKKPMLDVAFDLMSKKKRPVNFTKIWDEVSQVSGLTPQQCEDNIADFYSDLSLDGRFVNMGENKWDLRSRHKYNEVVIDTSDLLIDEDVDDNSSYDEDDDKPKARVEEY